MYVNEQHINSAPRLLLTTIVCCWLSVQAQAEPWSGPGDTRLRNDLQLLNDTGMTNLPLTAWPIPWGDINNSTAGLDVSRLSRQVQDAYLRVRQRAREEMFSGAVNYRFGAAAASEPRIIRSFEHTPREEGEVGVGLSWVGSRFAVNLNAALVDMPLDGDEVRPDGTYIGAAIGNWMLSAGWQERWWGPGRDGSMILSTNARPLPSIGIQRNLSIASMSKWFRWMGPWTLTSFMGLLDDERVIDDGLLWGIRGSFRPTRGLEIGLSRTAQWCGTDRDCSLKAFLRVLNGNDNRGANVDLEDEPGNQLAGIDVRWALPRQLPVALYMQWIAEDTRRTGAQLHQWLEQVGVEYWGVTGGVSHRTHFEIADTSCRRGSLGEGSVVSNCAYNNSIFQTGFRYKGRSIGHPMDGDGRSYSLGSTWVQPAGHTWSFSLRRIEINRVGIPDARHTVSATPQDLTDVQLSYRRLLSYGVVHAGFGLSRLDDELTGQDSSEVSGFVRWSTR